MMICGRCNTEYDEILLKECPACKEAEAPFYRRNLDSEESRPISIRLNAEERVLLEDIKLVLDLSSDGAALKQAAFVGWNVLQRTLGRDNLRWLASKERVTRGVKSGR